MEEKFFSLLEKMYGEMQKGFKEVRGEIEEVRKEVKEVKHNVVRLEDKIDNHLKALYDGYKQNTEKLCKLGVQINELCKKVERHEVEIRVIKGGK